MGWGHLCLHQIQTVLQSICAHIRAEVKHHKGQSNVQSMSWHSSSSFYCKTLKEVYWKALLWVGQSTQFLCLKNQEGEHSTLTFIYLSSLIYNTIATEVVSFFIGTPWKSRSYNNLSHAPSLKMTWSSRLSSHLEGGSTVHDRSGARSRWGRWQIMQQSSSGHRLVM